MRRRTLLASAAATIPSRFAIAQSEKQRVLKFVPQANLSLLDPVFTTAQPTVNHGYAIYDLLFGIDAKLQPKPQMAEGYTLSDDGRTYRIKLRDGLKFHNGEPVRAQDCAPSLARWAARETIGQTVWQYVEKCEAADDKTLEIVLKRPIGIFIDAIARGGASVAFMMPEHMAKTDPFKQVTETIGSGPYKFLKDEFVPGAHVAYSRNAAYVPRQEPAEWSSGGKVAHFDRIEWRIIPDTATAAAALQSGEIDWFEQPPPEIQQLLRRNRDIAIEAIDPLPLTGVLRFNALHAPFDQKRMRQAILPAVNQSDYMAAIVGAAGLGPTLNAVRQGALVAFANKECLVCAGGVFMRTAAKSGATVLPVDSEHNAIFQALGSGRREDVKLVILTASGGPFRTWTKDQMRTATLEQALKHPNWSMGPKNTIDSATMMNKGLELIEAQHIFGLKPHELDVLVHPQSIVHGLVEYRDGSVVAQLGSPDMRIPIAHCLAWPERIDGPAERLNLARIGNLAFEAPDTDRFPALRIARQVLEAGGATATVFNAANEIAVAAFVDRKLGFAGIAALVEATIDAAERRNATDEPQNIEDALAVDHIARSLAQDLLPEIAAKSL